MKTFRPLHAALCAATLFAALPFATAAEDELGTLRAKAEKGNAIAQYNLGLAYAEGHGTAPDPLEGYVWLSIALENGARGRALDTLSARLTPEQLTAARQRLDQRRATLGLAAPAPTAGPTVTASAPTAAETAEADKKQLSHELAAAWREADQLKNQLAQVQAAGADADKLRRERDSLSAKVTDLAGEIASLRVDREHLQKLGTQTQRESDEARASARESENRLKAAEARTLELASEIERVKGELDRARDSIAALKSGPVPPAPAGLDLERRNRELQAARADLEDARHTVTQLNAAVSKLSQDKTELEQMLKMAQTAALKFGAENDQMKARLTTLEAQTSTPTAAPAYPDLRERVGELEAQVTALRNAPPAYPDLRERVGELEAQTAALRSSPPAYPDLRERVATLEAQLGAVGNTKTGLESDLKTLRLQFNQSQQQAQEAFAQADQLRSANRDLQAKLDSAPKPTTADYPDLRGRVAELSAALAQAQAAATAPASPAYPDLRARVDELEKQLEAAQNIAPSYPDLRERTAQLEAALRAKQTEAPAYPDLRAKVAELEQKLEATTAHPTAPAYPDLRDRVAELEASLAQTRPAAATSTAPAYPDLRGRVDELEMQLAAVQQASAKLNAMTPTAEQMEELKQKVADTEEKLNTALRGYALMEKERDELAAKQTQAASANADTARLNDTVAALQRANADLTQQLAAARTQAPQVAEAPRTKPSRPAAVATPTPAAAATRTHTIAAGDSLSKISQRYYGTTSRWPEIYEANKAALGPNGILKIGMSLTIP